MSNLTKVSNIKLISGVWKHHANLIEYISSIKDSYGESFHFSFGIMKGLFLNDPELVKTVLLEKWVLFPKSRRYKVLSPLIGDSLLTSNGERWKERRVLAQPIFQNKIIASYRELIEKEVISSLDNISSGKSFDAYTHIAHYTFRVISKIIFSDDVDEVFDEFQHTVLRIQNECTKVALYPFPIMDKLPLPANITFRKLSAVIHRIVDGIIERRLKNPHADKYKDLLSRYLTAIKAENRSFSMLELRNELVTLLIAGNETTALTLSWAFLELSRSKHQTIQKDLISELSQLNLPYGEENSFLFLKQVPLLNRIINETLRLYPAVWLFSREAAQDFQLKNLNVKKGTLVLISPYFLQRNKEYWENPNDFDPNRFERAFTEDAFIPFARGPRTCMGMGLALFEIQLYLYHFFRKFEVGQSNELNVIKPKPLVNLYPDRSIQLTPELL